MTISNSGPKLSQKFNLFHLSRFVRVSKIVKCGQILKSDYELFDTKPHRKFNSQQMKWTLKRNL